MKNRDSRSLVTLLALALTGSVLACAGGSSEAPPADDDDMVEGGSGGSNDKGGSGGSSKAGSGGSSSKAGSGGSSSGGSGGSSNGGSGGSSNGGSGGSSNGGSAGGGGASGGSGGAGGASAPDAGADGPGAAMDGSAAEAGTGGGALALKVTGLTMSPNYDVPVFPASASNPMNQSPPIEWSGAPAGTKSFAVSMIDTGTTKGKMVVPGTGTKAHWVLWDIPPTVTMLKANLPHTPTLMDPMGSKTTLFAGKIGYFGPGAGSVNIYVITVWALSVDTLPGVKAGDSSQSVYGKLSAVSLGKASFVAVGKQGGL